MREIENDVGQVSPMSPSRYTRRRVLRTGLVSWRPCVCHATFDGFVRPILTHRICAPILTHRYPRFTSSAREPVLRADGAAVSAVVFDLYACPGLDFDQTPRTPRPHAAAIGMRVAYFSAPCRRTHARHTRAPHTRLFIFISMPPHTRVVVVSVWPSVWCWGA